MAYLLHGLRLLSTDSSPSQLYSIFIAAAERLAPALQAMALRPDAQCVLLSAYLSLPFDPVLQDRQVQGLCGRLVAGFCGTDQVDPRDAAAILRAFSRSQWVPDQAQALLVRLADGAVASEEQWPLPILCLAGNAVAFLRDKISCLAAEKILTNLSRRLTSGESLSELKNSDLILAAEAFSGPADASSAGVVCTAGVANAALDRVAQEVVARSHQGPDPDTTDTDITTTATRALTGCARLLVRSSHALQLASYLANNLQQLTPTDTALFLFAAAKLDVRSVKPRGLVTALRQGAGSLPARDAASAL